MPDAGGGKPQKLKNVDCMRSNVLMCFMAYFFYTQQISARNKNGSRREAQIFSQINADIYPICAHQRIQSA